MMKIFRKKEKIIKMLHIIFFAVLISLTPKTHAAEFGDNSWNLNNGIHLSTINRKCVSGSSSP